jgi:hypothetical protein
MIWLIILTFAAVAVFQIPRLKKAQKKKELVFFCVLLLTGFALFLLLNAGVKIPGPIKLVINFLNKIGLHY